MIRQFLTVIVGALILVPAAVSAQEPAPKKKSEPTPNRVYVKIIMPTAAAERDKKRPAVETWIAEDLRKRGQAKFTAVTKWVPLDLDPISGIPLCDSVWDGGALGDTHYCPVGADIPDRSDGRIKVLVDGWGPGGVGVTVAMTDEPGSRAIAGVKELKTDQGMPYVAVLIGPPPENSADPKDGKK
ncbi:MAG: hypothetical protein AAFN77_18765 [Planctomycetota bacterium]